MGMVLRRGQRTRPVPADLIHPVRAHVERWGVSGAARALGVSRSVILSVLASEPIMPGSIALIRGSLRARAHGKPTMDLSGDH